MLKFFFNLSGALPRSRAAQEAHWHQDPLSHPDLAAMDQRMLGDLPFSPVFPEPDQTPTASVVAVTRRKNQVPQKVWSTSSRGSGAAA